MPNYFSIIIDFDPSLNNQTLVSDFYDRFAECGASFIGGYFKSEGYSFEKVLEANREYLAGRSKDPHNGGFYQIMFRFGDFSEFRGYWHKSEDDLKFWLIVPQDEFYAKSKDGTKELPERMDLVKNLCLRLWELPAVICIQTSWESSGLAPKFNDISADCPPFTEIFSIIRDDKYSDGWLFESKPIEKNGILLTCEDNWLTKFKPKFEYGTDISAYLERAIEELKTAYHYHWADVSYFEPAYRYAIEEIKGEFHYVRYEKYAGSELKKTVLDAEPKSSIYKKIKNGREFIKRIVADNSDYVLVSNKKVATYKVSFKPGTECQDMTLERYEFNRRESGDFSLLVQSGDRWSGGSRDYFIPPEFFKGTYDEFLDKYLTLFPGDKFGLYKEDLINDTGLRSFLGF